MPDRPSFPIPPDIDPPRKCLCIEIPWTPEHKQVLGGLLWELTQWFNWQRDDASSGKQLAAVYRDVFSKIDWSDMSCCCDQTMTTVWRIDPENPFSVQISYDGGTTWITAPNQISQTMVQLPPITMDAHHTKCDAASNALQHIKDLKEKQATELETGGTIVEIALAVAVFLIGLLVAARTEGFALPAVVPLILEALGVIFALGVVAFNAYFTSDVYDDILCALYCNIEDDGTFTSGDFDAVIAKLESALPDDPSKDWLIQMLNVMGYTGLTQIASYGGSADADCSSCDCNDCSLSTWEEILGSPISRPDADTIIVTATTGHGDAQYYAGIFAPGDSVDCRELHDFVVTSGTANGILTYALCGEGEAATHTDPLGILDNGRCYRTVVLASTLPFSVKFECKMPCS